MSQARKVIITCAVTGAIHTPSMSPHLPVTADEIADAAIGAAEAGAAIVHLHARDPETGDPTRRPEAFAPFLQVIKQRDDCVINLTTGGAPYMTIEERVRPAATFKPEVASLNMGSMNFGLFPMLDRFKEFKHEWERQHLENSRNLVFKNTFQDIEYILAHLCENGTRFEFECYARGGPPDPGTEGWGSGGLLGARGRTMLHIELLLDARKQLGEGPYGKLIQRCDAQGRNVERWQVPEHIGSMCLRERGGAVVALRDGFHLFDFPDRRDDAHRRPRTHHPAHAAQRREGRPTEALPCRLLEFER